MPRLAQRAMPKSKSKVKAKQNSVILGFGKACVCTLNSSVFGSLRVNKIQNNTRVARITKSCGNAIVKAKSINLIVKKSAVMMFVRFEKINVFEAKSLINPNSTQTPHRSNSQSQILSKVPTQESYTPTKAN